MLDSLVENDSNLLNVELTITNIIKLATIGIVMAGSIIVPGISGSILLMSMGYYKTFLEITSQMIKLQNLSTNILLILPIGIGGIIGIIFFIKLIEFCLKRHRDKTNFLIFGIVMSSVIKVIILIFDYNITLANIIVGVLLLITGIVISTKFFKE
jgi:putative membrane protein